MYKNLTHKVNKQNSITRHISHKQHQNMSAHVMKHYVRQQITSGTHVKTIDDYSAGSLKDIVLYIIQNEFKKKYNNIRYNITSERENLLNKEQFYRSGLTYEQIKTLSEDDIQDLCLMITIDKNRDSLNYVRICPYLHKNPIPIKLVEEQDTKFNQPIKPIKLKILQKHFIDFTYKLNYLFLQNLFFIKSKLAQVYGYTQTGTQTRKDIYNHVKKVLIKAGLNITNMDYNKIPSTIYNTMRAESPYFENDRRTSYHKSFDHFFRDYFPNQLKKNITNPPTIFKYRISPFLASYISLDPTQTYSYNTISTQLKNKYPQHKLKDLKELVYVSKENYIKSYPVKYDDIMKYHTLIENITDEFIKRNTENIKYKYDNVLKSGLTLQRFYRKVVKPKLHPPPPSPPPEPEVVKVLPESSKQQPQPPQPPKLPQPPPKTPASAASAALSTSTEEQESSSDGESEDEESSDSESEDEVEEPTKVVAKKKIIIKKTVKKESSDNEEESSDEEESSGSEEESSEEESSDSEEESSDSEEESSEEED